MTLFSPSSPHRPMLIGSIIFIVVLMIVAFAVFYSRFLPARISGSIEQSLVGGQLDTSSMAEGEHELSFTARTRSGDVVSTNTTFTVGR